ncbi:hypothetical protein CAP35_13925 [Chitinophagaceae bacterium IBVUCB1]|nr:hypothetical protein CAP35_13925 [Chitinophagaceae bacterium IBVUCB1]
MRIDMLTEEEKNDIRERLELALAAEDGRLLIVIVSEDHGFSVQKNHNMQQLALALHEVGTMHIKL